MRVSIEVDADDFREAARNQKRFEQALSSVLAEFPTAAVQVRQARDRERMRTSTRVLDVARPSGANLGYRT